jgi:hypothetical protein
LRKFVVFGIMNTILVGHKVHERWLVHLFWPWITNWLVAYLVFCSCRCCCFSRNSCRNASGILGGFCLLSCSDFLVEYSTWSTTMSGIHTSISHRQHYVMCSNWSGIPVLPRGERPPRWNFGDNTKMKNESGWTHSTQLLEDIMSLRCF